MNQELLLQTFMDSCFNGVMAFAAVRDDSGKIRDFKWQLINRKAVEILKIEPQISLTGKNLLDQLPEFKQSELFKRFIKVVETGEEIDCEYSYQKIKEEGFLLYINAQKLEDGLLVSFVDQTGQIGLKEKEKSLKKAESIAHIGSWELDLNTEKAIWSDEMYRICGYDPKSFQPTLLSALNIIHPEDKDQTIKDIDHTLTRDIPFKSEMRLIRPGGDIRWVISKGELVKDEKGNPVKLFGYLLDITDRKTKEIELQKSENLFRSLYEGADIGIAILDLKGNLLKANPKLTSMLGYTEEELREISIKDITHPEDLNNDISLLTKLLTREINNYEIEKRYVTKNGDIFWGHLTTSVSVDESNEILSVIGMVQDINERKLAEHKLADSERRFKAIFDASYQLTGLIEPHTGIMLESNVTSLRFGGLKPEDVIGKPFWETHWWNYSEKVKKKLQEAIKTASQGQFVRYEAEIAGNNNQMVTVDFSLKPLIDESGKVVLIIPEARDITEKKKAEKILAESEERFKLFINQAPTAIAMLDKNLNYIAASRKWSEDFNITEKSIIGKNHYEVLPETKEDWKKVYQECLEGKHERRLKDSYTLSDGSKIWLRWEVRPWLDSNQNIGGLLIFTEDITDDVQNEERILKLNKELTELNHQKVKLLSVIAHDLKAPIASLVGFMDVIFINQEALSRQELMEYLRHLEKSTNNVKDLLDELLMWAKSQFNTLTFNPDSINLGKSVLKVLTTLQPAAENKGIKIETSVEPQLQLWADQNMLNAIIRNLLSNAIKFTRPGGKIKVQSQKKENFIEISVSDTGIGIKKEDLDKIFGKISYTTFGTAGEKGTGIGLELVRTFVDKHGGKLTVVSQPGKGSTFTFTIPIVK